MNPQKVRHQKSITGFRPVIRAREGRMLGIRQPLDGPVFEKLEDAECWCFHAMVSHYDRRLGLSDAEIHPFKGLVAYRLTLPCFKTSHVYAKRWRWSTDEPHDAS